MIFKITPHNIEIKDKVLINKGEYKATKFYFEFSNEYTDDLVKKAIFKDGNNNYEMVIYHNECDIPSEILQKRQIIVFGVYAYKINEDELELRYSPCPIQLTIVDGSYDPNTISSEEITPSQFEQYNQKLQDGLNKIEISLKRIDDKSQEIVDVEDEVEANEKLRVEHEEKRQENEDKRIENEEKRQEIFDTFKTKLDNGEFKGDKGDTGEIGPQGPIGPQGQAFTITKTYPSIKDMEDDFNNIDVGSYIMIASSVELEDNAKLYYHDKEKWVYITDFSGATGIQGEQGIQGIQGIQGPVGPAGPKPIKGVDYFTSTDKEELVNSVTSDATNSFNANVNAKTKEFNDNADAKLSAFNANYETKINNVNSSILEYEEETYYAPYADAKRLENHIANHFALTPDENTYGVDFPLWSTSQSSAGTKTDANVGLVCTPGTDTVKTIDTYPVAWDTYDVNAVVDNNGVRHITGIKGVANYHDVGKYDCFVLKRTYWQKIWTENGYLKIRRRFVPTEGYDICPLAINKDGTWNPWFVVPKYFAGDIDGKLYGSKNLLPAHSLTINASEHASDEEYSDNVSYSGLITLGHARGNYYSAGLLAEWYDTLTTFYLKFATRNTQSIMAGNTSNDRQYQVTQVTANSNKVVISTANANNIDLYSCVSVGDPESATNRDRIHAYMHNIAYDARVIGKEVVDANNTALILDHANFTTTSTSYVVTMHERSGFSDLVLGRTGSPISNTNGRHGFVFEGRECAVGGYEVMGNAFMDIINDSGDREIYYTNDSTKLTTNVTTAKSTYDKSDLVIKNSALNAWKYITEYGFDTKDGLAVPTNAGQSGSGSNTGYADGLYFDTGTSGQREFLAFGPLYHGTTAGLSSLRADLGLSFASWYFLARLSVNGVGGELAE